jgi:hypothetical protein
MLWRGSRIPRKIPPDFGPQIPFEAVETFFVEFSRAWTPKSLGGHLGVNISDDSNSGSRLHRSEPRSRKASLRALAARANAGDRDQSGRS